MRIPRSQWSVSTQTRIALSLKIVPLIVTVVIVYWRLLFPIFQNVLQNKASIYVLFVPCIIVYLVYRKRKMLRAVITLDEDRQTKKYGHLGLMSGVLVCAIALFLYWQSSYVFTPLQAHLYTFEPVALQLLTLPIFTAGLILILFNHQTLRQLAPPLAFLLFLVPPPIETLVPALLAAFVLISLGAVFIYHLSSVHRPISRYFFRPGGISEEKEEKCESRNVLSQQGGEHHVENCGIFHFAQLKFHDSDVAKIVATLIIGILLLMIQSPAFAVNKTTALSFSNTASGPQYSTSILPAQSQYSLAFRNKDQPLEIKARQQNQDLLALEYLYTPIQNKSLQEVFVGLDISSPQSSLLEDKPYPRIVQLERNQIQIDNNHGSIIQAEYLVIESTDVGSIKTVLNWTTSPVFSINQTSQQEQVQIALTIYNVQTENLPEAKQQLVDLAAQINGYWLPDENLPQTTAVFLSHEGMNLAAAASIGLLATIGYYTTQNQKRKKQSLTVLSKLNGLSIEIVKILQKENRPSTTDDLVEALKRASGKLMTPDQLETLLQELENLGVVESQVSSRNDFPVQTWKTLPSAFNLRPKQRSEPRN